MISSSNTPSRRYLGEYMAKFMLSLRDENFQLLTSEAQERGISIQELLRAVIIPDWVRESLAKTTGASRSLGQTRAIVPDNGNAREQLLQPLNRVR